ncbi:MAG: hypothetical protein JXA09_06960 [Anaerolineae bacterium]|nr:hypothetical protein [Anaerolineae bacterium]
MDQVRHVTAGSVAAIASLALAVLAAVAFGIVRWSGAFAGEAPTSTAPGARPVPPIDAAQPTEIETATFAMG